MSVDDAFDPFDGIVNGLSMNTDCDEIVNVQTLSNIELIDILLEINDNITKQKSLFKNDTEWQRDQHSLRAAILIEIARRGMG